MTNELAKAVDKASRKVNAIRKDISILVSLKNQNLELSRRVERANTEEARSYMSLVEVYRQRIEAKTQDLKNAEVELAYARDAYTRSAHFA